MIYSAARPPVIRFNAGSNLGFIPQMNLVTLAGTVISLTSPAMVQVNNTPMWYYVLANNMVIPEDYTEYTYYVSSPAGDIIGDGNLTIEDNAGSTNGAIVQADIDVKSLIISPGSLSTFKNYTVRFTPRAADKTFIEGVKELGVSPVNGPLLTLNFQNALNSSFNVSTNMTLGTEEWVYSWQVGYSTPSDLVLVTIQCQSGGREYKYSEEVEVLKPSQYNPQRISVGGVS